MIALVLSGCGERLEREQHGRAWLAWHVCAIPRMRKFPELEKLMGVKRKVRRQTAAEMDAIFRAWAARG